MKLVIFQITLLNISAENSSPLPDTHFLSIYKKHVLIIVADYVWLPLRFEEPTNKHPDGMVYIDWFDEWRIEDWE